MTPIVLHTARAWISLAGIGILFLGCATTKEDIFPKDLKPMTEVYDDHFASLRNHGIEGARKQLHEPRQPVVPTASQAAKPQPDSDALEPGEGILLQAAAPVEQRPARAEPPAAQADTPLDLEDYTRTAVRELEVLFPLLPNPTLVMYVYPHLAEERAGVPGYATKFRLYERDEYALPGEASQQHSNP